MSRARHALRGALRAAPLALLGCAGILQAQPVTPGNPLDQLPEARPLPLPPGAAPGARVTVQGPADPSTGRLVQVVRPARFDIEGVNAIPFDAVAARFVPLAGQPVTVAQLVAAANEATALYRAQGHPLSFVFLPEQSFADGVVRVVAVEGYVAAVRIEGDAGSAEPRLRAIAERLVIQRPLAMASFERVTQLLARLPGLTVDATAALPANTDGATTLVLKVKREPYNVSVGADLRQPTPRAVLSGVLNDPLVPGGQLSASTLLGNWSREKLLTVGYSHVVGADGLTLRANFSSYRGFPDETLGRGASIERFNTNRRVDLVASYPLLLDARSSLTLSGGAYAVDNIDDYRAPTTGRALSEDTRVRALFAQLSWSDVQPDRSRSASAMLAQGLRGAGASASVRSNVPGLAGSNPARLDFTRIAIDARQRDRYANKLGTEFSLGAQYSPHTLAASERVSFGGTRFGRGYAAGQAAGDSGWGLGAEVNRLFTVDQPWLRQVEPYLLVEAARVSSRVGEPLPASLRSVALGVRFSDNRHYSLDIAVAKPTGEAAPTNPARRVRLALLLTYQLAAR